MYQQQQNVPGYAYQPDKGSLLFDMTIGMLPMQMGWGALNAVSRAGKTGVLNFGANDITRVGSFLIKTPMEALSNLIGKENGTGKLLNRFVNKGINMWGVSVRDKYSAYIDALSEGKNINLEKNLYKTITTKKYKKTTKPADYYLDEFNKTDINGMEKYKYNEVEETKYPIIHTKKREKLEKRRKKIKEYNRHLKNIKKKGKKAVKAQEEFNKAHPKINYLKQLNKKTNQKSKISKKLKKKVRRLKRKKRKGKSIKSNAQTNIDKQVESEKLFNNPGNTEDINHYGKLNKINPTISDYSEKIYTNNIEINTLNMGLKDDVLINKNNENLLINTYKKDEIGIKKKQNDALKVKKRRLFEKKAIGKKNLKEYDDFYYTKPSPPNQQLYPNTPPKDRYNLNDPNYTPRDGYTYETTTSKVGRSEYGLIDDIATEFKDKLYELKTPAEKAAFIETKLKQKAMEKGANPLIEKMVSGAGAIKGIGVAAGLLDAYFMANFAASFIYEGVKGKVTKVVGGMNRLLNSNDYANFGGQVFDNSATQTMRQRSVQAINQSRLNARTFIGNEAAAYHQ